MSRRLKVEMLATPDQQISLTGASRLVYLILMRPT